MQTSAKTARKQNQVVNRKFFGRFNLSPLSKTNVWFKKPFLLHYSLFVQSTNHSQPTILSSVPIPASKFTPKLIKNFSNTRLRVIFKNLRQIFEKSHKIEKQKIARKLRLRAINNDFSKGTSLVIKDRKIYLIHFYKKISFNEGSRWCHHDT